MSEFSENQECLRDEDSLARVQSWVLGHGDPVARASFEEHLRSCEACRKEAERIAGLIARVGPLYARSLEEPNEELLEQELWARLEKRLDLACASTTPSVSSLVQSWRAWAPESTDGARVIPANDGEFQAIGVPGISVRRLHVSGDRREVTMLVRMESGAAFPPHRHGGLERCLVLSGELHVGDEVARAGDYVGAEAGSLHPVQWTETGCELFITSSTSDELIDS